MCESEEVSLENEASIPRRPGNGAAAAAPHIPFLVVNAKPLRVHSYSNKGVACDDTAQSARPKRRPRNTECKEHAEYWVGSYGAWL